jgi:hypothetical protein
MKVKETTETRLDFGMAKYSLSNTQVFLSTTEIPTDAVPAQPTTDGSTICLHHPSTPSLLGQPPIAPPACLFQEYLGSLPEWQQEILAGVSGPSGPDSLGQVLLQGLHLFLCSDGGAKDHAGSFGWVIATSTQILWECSGIASRWYANSFRSEGVGQLSLLVFFEAYILYHGLQDIPTPVLPPESDPWLRIATDNEDLITHITQGLTTKKTFTGAALCSEYDVLFEIVEIARRLPVKLTWEHVKGHQDDQKKWYKLDWMKTLNVCADHHATDGLAIPGDPSTLVTLIPSSKLALRINHTDITAKYATHLFSQGCNHSCHAQTISKALCLG